MNLQQVKATADDIGDGGDDITSESLTKYEKACMDLGVALKEVKNGVWVLRDPMKILNDLAVAFNNEADNSIKKANLINAVGGKYRGNQLSSLLSNWKTYEKMLAEFNSSDAVGSAMEESMKSANSWEGSLNKVSDSWYKLVNEFINSEDAIDVLNSLNVIIQKIAEDRTVGALGGVTDTLVGILDVLSKIVDKFGIIPTTIATIGTVQAFKGNSIFGNIVDVSKNSEKSISRMVTAFKELKTAQSTLKSFNIDLSRITPNDLNTLQEYVDLINKDVDVSTAFNQVLSDSSKNLQDQAVKFSSLHQAYADGKISQEQYAAATRNLAATQRVATGTTKALQFAFNLMGNIAFTLVVTGIVKIIESLVIAEERAIQKNKDFIESTQESIENYKKEEDFLTDIIDRYTQLYMSTDDVTSIKKDLSAIQDELIQKYGEEANEIDLVNQKYSENIRLAREKRQEIAEDFLRDNAMNIRKAKNRDKEIDTKVYSATVNVEDTETLSKYRDYIKKYNGLEQYVEGDKYGTFHFEVDGLEAQIAFLEMSADIMAKNKSTSEDIYNKTIEELQNLREIRDNDKDILEKAEYYQSVLDTSPTKEYDKALEDLINKQREYEQLVNGNGSKFEIQTAQNDVLELKNAALEYAGTSAELRQEVLDVVNASDVPIESEKVSIDNLITDIKEIAGEDFSNTLADVDKIKSAMQKLANGEMLEWDEVSTLLFDIDTDKILDGFEEIGGKYRMVNGDMSTMITLKDSILKKQIEEINGIKAEHKETLELLKAELELNKARLSRSQSSTDAEYFKDKISGIESEMEDVNNLIRDDNILIRHLNSQLGDTVDRTEAWKKQQEKLNDELKQIQDKADDYEKAFLNQITNITDELNERKDVLNEEKEALQEQLDILNEQKDSLEEIIDNYKELPNIVEDFIGDEIDSLEKERDGQKQIYDDKINALKEIYDKQEEENSLAEKELEVKQKLADLEKARQTKVKTYSESRGWHFDTDKEAVANAQAAANEAQAEYNKAVTDKEHNDQIKNIEAERDAIIAGFDEQIKAYEDYVAEWKSVLEKETNAENERLANEILGSNWREKIKKKDTSLIQRFKNDFRSYSSQLESLVNNEIESLNNSIEAKENEINAIDKTISQWNKYKSAVEKSIDDIKSANKSLVELSDEVRLSEQSNLDERGYAFWNFKENYISMCNEIIDKQNEINNLDFSRIEDSLGNVIETFEEWTERWNKTLETQNELHFWNSASGLANLPEHAEGGVADYTGLAMLHGTKQKAETIFNAQQSKELYNMVKTGSFGNLVAQKAVEGLTKSLTTTKSTSNFNNSRNTNSVVIQKMEIKADNPLQFHEQFTKEINQYMRIELSESRVK